MTVALGGGGVVAEHLLAVYNWGNSFAHSLDEQLKIHTHTMPHRLAAIECDELVVH